MVCRNRIAFLGAVLLWVVGGCASAPSHRPVDEKPWEDTADRTPVESKDLILPPYPTPAGQVPTPHTERKVALVLGGAGVASFATVGLLKALQQERVKIDLIVTTGWPTLFVLGKAFLSTIHELEWFATRLNEKDFFKVALFDSEKGFASHERLGTLIESTFHGKEIQDSRVPVVISAANIEYGEPEVFDRGQWKEPLLKAMSVPGLFRPYPAEADRQFISSLHGLDVDEARRRGAEIVVAVYMYDDYLRSLASGKKSADALFRKLYRAQLRVNLGAQLRHADIYGGIELFKSPTDFSAKRRALLAGYEEGLRIAKGLRSARGRQYPSRQQRGP